MKIEPLLLPVPPTPYEYALMSQLAYHEHLANLLPTHYPASYQSLLTQGWRIEIDSGRDSPYANIWVNDAKKQVVIAYQGSQNIESWVSDLECMVQLKPGFFMHAAVALLSHPSVLVLRQKDYRLSSTGHSLGGFLAQISVFWSQRQELEQTHYLEMSAVVFDSPGTVEFLEVLSCSLASEKESISISQLNIQNFCAMPSGVNSFGKHTGTLWHLGGTAEISFSFTMDPSLQNILGGFNAETGYPRQFRQMLDWPQANYSAYEGITRILKHTTANPSLPRAAPPVLPLLGVKQLVRGS